jgi:hypothetical protein
VGNCAVSLPLLRLLIASFDVVLAGAERRKAFGQARLSVEVFNFEERKLAALDAAPRHHAHEPVGLAVRRPRERQRVDETEDRRVRAASAAASER